MRVEDGTVTTVRYQAVNAMLLNEFLKEHRRIEEQGATIARRENNFESELAEQQKEFEATIAQQQKQIEALAVTVQKVSDHLEVNERAPQLVANDQ